MIPIIINNRNLLTWPRAMLEKIKTFNNVGEIIIVDNDSTYPPLSEWYETNPCKVIRTKNLGHTAPWQIGLIESLSVPYVVTDPDLGLDEVPISMLDDLNLKLTQLPHLQKIGPKLNHEIVEETSPYYSHLQTYEKRRWSSSKIVNGVYVDVHIDTTFALYNVKHYFVGGGSLAEYSIRHYPWEFTDESRQKNLEFSYYISHANNSSSYKTYLKL